jgi:hypothetical protein
MSHWYNPKKEDMDITEDGKELHVFLCNDPVGAVYVSLDTAQVRELLEIAPKNNNPS